ncbi:pentapeptide repeat-containing protein, partial [bacterium]|nr:pentapeptide repeat-containing protein [bacterium]
MKNLLPKEFKTDEKRVFGKCDGILFVLKLILGLFPVLQRRGASFALFACSFLPLYAGEFLVSTLADDGTSGSFRSGIIAANGSSAIDTIGFEEGLSGTITLTSDLPQITESLTITGPSGSESVTISGDNSWNMFSVSSGKLLTLSELTFTKNSPSGGGSIISLNNSDAVATSITVTENTYSNAFQSTNASTLTISGSTFSNNDQTIFTSDHGSAPSDSLTLPTNRITVTGSEFKLNSGIIFSTERYVKIDNCVFSENSGVIGYFGGLNRYQVLNSEFSGNTSSPLFSFSSYHMGSHGAGFSSDHHLFDGNTFSGITGDLIHVGSDSRFGEVTTIRNNTFEISGDPYTYYIVGPLPYYSNNMETPVIGPGANLMGADLTGADLSGADLTDAVLSYAILHDADLTGANLSGADLAGADLFGADLTGADLTDADLTGADLTDADLTGADLSDANLSDANLYYAILHNAILHNAYLVDADLCVADLSGADLTGADLNNAELDDTNLTGANLSGADLINADLWNTNLTGVNLTGAYLSYANLVDANLTGADLSGADLTDADLLGAILHDADLTGADLSGADLSGANLTDANLTGANLTGANLTDANLTGADLTNADLDTATVNEFTTISFPSGWTIENAMVVEDITAPVITVTSGTDTVWQGSIWTDAGATADTGETVSVVSNTVDTSAAGTYTVTYSVTDAAGNVATQVTRTVTVVAPTVKNAYEIQIDANTNIALDSTVDGVGGLWSWYSNGVASDPSNSLSVFLESVRDATTHRMSHSASNPGSLDQTSGSGTSSYSYPGIPGSGNDDSAKGVVLKYTAIEERELLIETTGGAYNDSVVVIFTEAHLNGGNAPFRVVTMDSGDPTTFKVKFPYFPDNSDANIYYIAFTSYNSSDLGSDTPLRITASDITAPVITVTSGTDTVEQGSTWTDAGATADTGETVTASGAVDASAGTYTITYTATDAAGNIGTATRTVRVVVNGKIIEPGADLYGANLYGANLYGADLSGASLYGALLTGANLSGADLSGANLYGANLSNANLSGANLTGTNLYGALLTGADLSGATVNDVTEISLPGRWIIENNMIVEVEVEPVLVSELPDITATEDGPDVLIDLGPFFNDDNSADDAAMSYAVTENTNGAMVTTSVNTDVFVLKGSYRNGGGYAGEVVVDGNYAYVADGQQGLTVVNVGDPESPTLAGNYDPSWDIGDVAISGGYAYLANQSGGVRVVSIADPSNPTEVAQYNTAGSARGIDVSGNYAYVADGSGLVILDVSNPSAPVLVGTSNTPDFAYRVDVEGGHAYVADRAGGLQIVDISDPSSPQIVGSYSTQAGSNWSTGAAWDVKVEGGYAYVAASGAGLIIVDVSNPANPVLEGSYSTNVGDARGVYVLSGKAYLAASSSGLLVIDVTSPSSPVLVGTYDSTGSAMRVTAVGDYAYLADWGGGLKIVDTTYITDELALSFEPDTSGSADITVTATSGADTVSDTFNVTIANVNDAPQFDSDSGSGGPFGDEWQFTIGEDASVDAVVGTVTATDVDGDTLDYSITDGNEGGLFTIDSSSGEIKVAGVLDYETATYHSLKVQVADTALSATTWVRVDVSNVPEITLAGDAVVTIEVGGSYTEDSATSDGGETVAATGIVNTNTVGSYTITYSATDNFNNTGTATRTVSVVDITKPVITLAGDGVVTIEAGESYDEQGVTVSDNYDTNLTVTIDSSAVNTSLLGSYSVIYSATDGSGNVADEVTRMVTVVDTTPPVITLIGEAVVTIEMGG